MAIQHAIAAPFKFLQLLADEQRWRLLTELARSDRKVSELTALVGKPQNLVSYHLASLRDAGIVSARRSSADRRDTYYRMDLHRCADLLSAIGPALQPGLRLEVVDPRTPMPREEVAAHAHTERRNDVLLDLYVEEKLREMKQRKPSRARTLADLDRRAPRSRPTVLFLCTGNSARSQMAEALLEHHSRGAIQARSAGSHPKPLHPNAVRVMAEGGIDISTRKSKHLDRFRKSRFDRVITLCDKVREICPQFPAAAVAAHWSMPDPAAVPPPGEGDGEESGYAAFKRTAEELESRIPFLIGELMLNTERRAVR